MILQWELFFKDSDLQGEIETKANHYPEERSIYVDFEIIDDKSPDLAESLLNNPLNTIYSANYAINNLTPPDLNVKLKFRVLNIPPEISKIEVRDIRTDHLEKLISVEGFARKVTEVRPRLEIGVFKCARCGAVIKVVQDSMLFKEPLECSKEEGGCGRTGASTEFKLLKENSSFIDTQKIEIQESPEGLRGGTQPQRLTIYLEEDLVGLIKPGDRIIANGILKSRQRGRYPIKSTIFDIFIDVNSIKLEEQEFEEINITDEEEKQIIKLSKLKSIYQKIRASITPTIYGLETEKEGLALQLFGGLQKIMPDSTRIRGDIHILLVGDPGTAKSQLLRYISHLAPRGIYTSGKSSTSAGLTASAVKDDFGEGRWTLEAGALVLSDKGTCCVDELDKMKTEDRSAMHEAMEQQTVSISKAGITATLQCKCAVLGASNPKFGRFDEYSPVPEQINMSPALLSRFDIIFSITDKPDRKIDFQLAEHVLNVHKAGEISLSLEFDEKTEYEEKDKTQALRIIEPPIEPEFFRKYIAYAKRNIYPVMTTEATNRIRDYYVNLRNKSYEQGESIAITPRQLESFVRLAESSAKMRLSNKVTIDDAERAIKIVEYYLYKVARDESGTFDIDRVNTGTPHAVRDKIKGIKEIIKKLVEGEEGKEIFIETIIEEAEKQGIEKSKTKEVINNLIKVGDYYEPSEGKIRLKRRD